MTIKVGINGMGRIGRMIVRSIYENHKGKIIIKHINNRSSSEICANLLKYDSIHGNFSSLVKSGENYIKINKEKISYTQHTMIDDIKWKKYGVDYVFECTGKFNSKHQLLPHLKNGVNKVIVSAPCKMADKTVVFGVNHKKIHKNDRIISAASCTTNCLAPVADVINKNFIIINGFMTTIHAYTSDQRILDNSHKDPRRARSASQSIVPTSTGASKSIGDIIPSLKGKLEGIAMRVPTPNVSLVEFIFNVKKNISVKRLNDSLSSASRRNLKNILDVTNEKLVSIDFNHQ